MQAAVWSIQNLATRRPHAVPNYSPVLTAAVCYVLTEKATIITTNLQASVSTQAHAVSMSSDSNVTVLESTDGGKNQVISVIFRIARVVRNSGT